MKETDAAWLAGLLEGEGSFVLDAAGGPNRRPRIRVKLTMTDEDVVVRAHELLGLTCKIGYRKPICSNPSDSTRNVERWSDSYEWKASGYTAERIMRLVRPYMGKRRGAKIDELLAMENLSHHPRVSGV